MLWSFAVVWCIEHCLFIKLSNLLLVFKKLILQLLDASLSSCFLCCCCRRCLRLLYWRFKLTVEMARFGHYTSWRLCHRFLICRSNHYALRMLGLTEAYFLYWISIQAWNLCFVHMGTAQYLPSLFLIGLQVDLCWIVWLKYAIFWVWICFVLFWLTIHLASLITFFALWTNWRPPLFYTEIYWLAFFIPRCRQF